MNHDEVAFYITSFSPLAWLIWLTLRPFLVGMNRLLLLIFGMSLHGFFLKAIVIPLTDVQRAHVAARHELARLAGSSNPLVHGEASHSQIFYFVSCLVVIFLLLLWLQRVLSVSPRGK